MCGGDGAPSVMDSIARVHIMPRSTSPEGIAETISHEGIVPYRYLCSARVDTFGVGHTHNAGAPDPRQMPFGREYPMKKVVETFRRDLRKFEKRVNAAVKVPLKQHEFDALVSFDFNTGGVHRAQATRHLNAGNRTAAADALMGWSKPPEIIPRRRKEQALFRDGTYLSGFMANVYPADERGRVIWSQGRRVNLKAAVPELFAANQADDRADRDRNKAAATGTAGAGAEAAGHAPEAVPVPPEIPVDPQSLQIFLVLLGAGLIAAATVFAWRWWRGRQDAKDREANAVARLDVAMDQGEPVNELEAMTERQIHVSALPEEDFR